MLFFEKKSLLWQKSTFNFFKNKEPFLSHLKLYKSSTTLISALF